VRSALDGVLVRVTKRGEVEYCARGGNWEFGVLRRACLLLGSTWGCLYFGVERGVRKKMNISRGA
jgi:hypothetical protein